MAYYAIKIAVTTILIVLISEIAKRSTLAGAILASLPLVSVLGMIWLYVDTKDVGRVITLSGSIFWLVLPSLALFLVLPLLLKQGINFYLGMTVAIAVTAACYWLMVSTLGHFGISL